MSIKATLCTWFNRDITLIRKIFCKIKNIKILTVFLELVMLRLCFISKSSFCAVYEEIVKAETAWSFNFWSRAERNETWLVLVTKVKKQSQKFETKPNKHTFGSCPSIHKYSNVFSRTFNKIHVCRSQVHLGNNIFLKFFSSNLFNLLSNTDLHYY